MSSVYSSYIKRMRMCSNGNCKGCTYAYEGLTNTEECKEDLLYDAAEQLEDAGKCNAKLVKKCKEMEKRIARLEEDLKTREAEREVMQDTIKICEEAADRYKAQLPKEGEWIMDGKYNRHCSRCNENVVWSFNYCPNCGAKMKGKETDDGIHVRE